MTATELIARAVDERAKDFIELSDRIWDDPELRWTEFGSTAAQRELAAGARFRITESVARPCAFTSNNSQLIITALLCTALAKRSIAHWSCGIPLWCRCTIRQFRAATASVWPAIANCLKRAA